MQGSVGIKCLDMFRVRAGVKSGECTSLQVLVRIDGLHFSKLRGASGKGGVFTELITTNKAEREASRVIWLVDIVKVEEAHAFADLFAYSQGLAPSKQGLG